MKKLLLISTIVLGTFASAGIASADSIYTDNYADWAVNAFNVGSN